METKKGRRINWCKILGHKWVQVFIRGTYNDKSIKFIATKCNRCDLGYKEVSELVDLGTGRKYNTYSEKFFVEDPYPFPRTRPKRKLKPPDFSAWLD